MTQPDAALLRVTGETRLYLVMGDPVAQVRSTAMFNALCADAGIDAVFAPLRFAIEDFERVALALRCFSNLAGMLATIPHKTPMLQAVDHSSPRAKMIGAVNVIRVNEDGSWSGDAFDGLGYVRGLHACGHDPRGRCVQLIGMGGAGASMAFALAEAGVGQLRMFDLDARRTEKVATGLAQHYPQVTVRLGPVEPAGADIVANATPLGMATGDPLPADPGSLEPGQLVTDMIMRPAVTPFLEAARARGCAVVPGYEALKGQAAVSMEFLRLSGAGGP